eukprot:gene22183-28293_t
MDVVLISLNPITGADFNFKTETDVPSKSNDTSGKTDAKAKPSAFAALAKSMSTKPAAIAVPFVTPPAVVCGPYMIGIVVDQRFEGGARLSRVKVLSSGWETMKESIKVVNANSSATGSSAGSATSSSKSSGQIANKNGRLRSYSMHFVVVENVRSSWREFQAVHDLGSNVPLLVEVLGHSRSIDMCHTPPPVNDETAKPAGGSNGAEMSSSSSSSSSVGSSTQRVSIEQEVMEWRMNGVTDKFMTYLRRKYNPSQLHAIRTAATQMGFTLIQGPPGTGKTSTIIGMLNSIHIREYNRYYELALSTVLGPVGQACRESNSQKAWLDMVAQLTRHKPHILVVAPSNIAVDNIIERIMSDGFLDGNGGKYSPHMLRVGGGKTPRVQSVSLEDTVRAEEAVLFTKGNERQIQMEQLSTYVTQVIKDVYFLQTMLNNMKLAFVAHYPLPEGFELCVCEKTARPFWKNHILRAESFDAPVIVKREAAGSLSGAKVRFNRIEKLPQFMSCAHHLTQLLDQLANTNLKRSWLQAVIGNSTNNRQGGGSGNNNNGSSNKELLENSIIDSAQLLFTTLNSSGHPCMEATEFCVTVIDEAAQCVEPSVLIALRRGCKQCIMVGDQKQLSATTFSPSVKAVGFDRSLFERLIDSGHPYIMLDTQYRMVPGISAYPSNEFYAGALRNGGNVCAPNFLPAYIKDNAPSDNSSNTMVATTSSAPLFSSFMFFNLYTSCESDPTSTTSQSKTNRDEVQLCVNIVRVLAEEAKRSGVALGSVGVITPYSDQLVELRRAMITSGLMAPTIGVSGSSNSNLAEMKIKGASSSEAKDASKSGFLDIECNTVDGFQGREKDFIVISSVRANNTGSIGFVADPRRLNVALTRGKFGMFVVGHAQTLSCNERWSELMVHAQNVDGFVQVERADRDIKSVLQEEQTRREQATRREEMEQQRIERQAATRQQKLSNNRNRPPDSDETSQSNKKQKVDVNRSNALQSDNDNLLSFRTGIDNTEAVISNKVTEVEEGEVPEE